MPHRNFLHNYYFVFFFITANLFLLNVLIGFLIDNIVAYLSDNIAEEPAMKGEEGEEDQKVGIFRALVNLMKMKTVSGKRRPSYGEESDDEEEEEVDGGLKKTLELQPVPRKTAKSGLSGLFSVIKSKMLEIEKND